MSNMRTWDDSSMGITRGRRLVLLELIVGLFKVGLG